MQGPPSSHFEVGVTHLLATPQRSPQQSQSKKLQHSHEEMAGEGWTMVEDSGNDIRKAGEVAENVVHLALDGAIHLAKSFLRRRSHNSVDGPVSCPRVAHRKTRTH